MKEEEKKDLSFTDIVNKVCFDFPQQKQQIKGIQMQSIGRPPVVKKQLSTCKSEVLAVDFTYNMNVVMKCKDVHQPPKSKYCPHS